MKIRICILLSLCSFLSLSVFALDTNESVADRLESYSANSDPRYATYVRNVFESPPRAGHIRVGYNVTPISILDITTPTALTDALTVPSLRLTNAAYANMQSFVHYQLPGHWIIQSGSTSSGIVFLEPRGGSVQIGSKDVGTSTEYTKKFSSSSVTSFNVFAESSHFYKNVIVHDPSGGNGPSFDLYAAITQIQQTSSVRASNFIDRDNTDFLVNPSGNSTLHTVSLSYLTDRQLDPDSVSYTLDLSNKSNMYRLSTEGTLRVMRSALRFQDRTDDFVVSANQVTRMLTFNSTTTNASAGKIRMNRVFILNTANPKKIELTNFLSGSDINGIHALGKPALTADGTGSERLYINPKNQFMMIRIGNPTVASTNMVVHGTLSASREFVGYGTIPVGGIIAWTGHGETPLPTGWTLCDGRTLFGITTPDLRDRFIVGTNKNANGGFYPSTPESGSYQVGNTGGQNAVVLSIAEIPSHSHTWNDFSWNIDEEDGQWDSCCNDAGWIYHNDRLTEWNDGTNWSQPHENRPPYYALAFIMRVQ